jgi:signal transduction histidine kinase
MSFKLFLVLCFCLSVLSMIAQIPAIDRTEDSLQNELKKLSSKSVSIGRDSLIIKTLANIFMSFPSKEIPQREFYNDSLKRFSFKTKWRKAHAYQMYISGFMHTFKGENTLAFNDIEKALIEFKNLNDEENYQKCSERLSILMSRNMMVRPLNNEHLEKKYLSYISEQLEEAKTKLGGTKLAGAYAGFGQYYLMKKDYKKSAEYYQEQARYSKLNTNKNLEFFEYHSGLFYSRGLCVLYQNPNDQEALKTVNKIIQICQTEKHNNYEKYLLLIMIHYLGNYYAEQKDYQNTLRIGLIGKNLEEPPQMPFYTYLVDNVLAKAYKGLKQSTKALQYLEKVTEYQEKSGTQELTGNLAEWQLKYEDEKQKTQITTLENDKLQTEANRQKWIRNLLIISLIFGISLVFYFFKNNQQLKTKNREIEEALQKGQTIERKRVAEELHDNLSAKISGIRWRLEAIEPDFKTEKHKKIYESSVNALAEVYTDVRLIAHNLLPAELETKGLPVALENLIKELNGLQKTEFTLNIASTIGRFQNKIEYEIFSIVLELSNNILKHSKAINAFISLEIEKNNLKLLVSDNGIGIEEDSIKQGMGMSNLKSRVASLNGKMTIENREGVWVVIVVPVLGS